MTQGRASLPVGHAPLGSIAYAFIQGKTDVFVGVPPALYRRGDHIWGGHQGNGPIPRTGNLLSYQIESLICYLNEGVDFTPGRVGAALGGGARRRY